MVGENDLDTRIRGIFQRLFEVRPEGISDQARRGDFDRWDSLGHLNLVEALREEFQIGIPPEEALEMETVADIKRVISALLASEALK